VSKNKKLDALVKQTEGLITRVVLLWNYIVFGFKADSCMFFLSFLKIVFQIFKSKQYKYI